MTSLVRAIVALSFVVGTPLSSFAQTASQREESVDSKHDIEDQMGVMDARITAAEAKGDIGRSEAASLRRKMERTRQSFRSTSRQQGFMSASERASYQRTLNTVSSHLPEAEDN